MCIIVTEKETQFLKNCEPLGLVFKHTKGKEFRSLSIGLDLHHLQALYDQDEFQIQIRPFNRNYIEIIAVKN